MMGEHFKVHYIQIKSHTTKKSKSGFCNKISISSYSSNIDPQTSKRMFMDEFHSNCFQKHRGMWIKCVCKLCYKKTFYYKNGSIRKTSIVTQRRLFVINFQSHSTRSFFVQPV